MFPSPRGESGDGLIKIGSGLVFVLSNEDREWYYEWSMSLSIEVKDMRQWKPTVIGLIASASLDNTIVVWDWQHARHVAASLGGVVASCPVKGLFAASSGTPPIVLQLLETQGFRIVFSTQVNEQYILDMAFSPDGEYLVTVGNRQTVRVWRLRSP